MEIFFRPPLIHYYGQRSVILSNQVWNNKATEINQAFKNYFVLKIVNLLLNVGNTDPFYTGFRHCKLFSFFFISLGRRRQSLHMLHETLEEPTIYTFLSANMQCRASIILSSFSSSSANCSNVKALSNILCFNRLKKLYMTFTSFYLTLKI